MGGGVAEIVRKARRARTSVALDGFSVQGELICAGE
jgi:hypothetical protein